MIGRKMADALVATLLGPEPPLAVRFWDGTWAGAPADKALATVVVRSPRALRRILYSPGELGLGRAYVAGELDVEGDIYQAVEASRAAVEALGGPNAEWYRLGSPEGAGGSGTPVRVKLGARGWAMAAVAAARLGVFGLPLPPPPEEARLTGPVHSKRRDAAAVAHHYDVPGDFYRLFLGETMTYSCAYFAGNQEAGGIGLDAAQRAKHELISAKLGLRPGMRLLDVGCGWGEMVIHAASVHGVEAVGVTLSRRQADLARRRVEEAGLSGKVEIRYQDYRDVADGPYDAISSIGMFEHVGHQRLSDYFSNLYGLLGPGGRLLNHAISTPPGDGGTDERSFLYRYVFPDGELMEVGQVVSAMQGHGFEVRDVESLREHYGLTLRHWVSNLEAGFDQAVALAGPGRARVWHLYLAGS
ncbi:MAG: class I SAM-dependent methyltransferase, partial [Acidimicrobiales bacterium]